MDTFGRNYRVSVFGESHGGAIGVVVDGVPAGIVLSEQDFMTDIDRRRSGAKGTTPRREPDVPEVLSGIYEGHTTGAPLAVIFRNGNTRSSDYDLFRSIPRPGHADFVAGVKWHGFNDPRGGGHFSGRLTLPLVAAGTVAKKILSMLYGDAVTVSAELAEIGGIASGEPDAMQKWDRMLDEAEKEGDSLGGVVECVILAEVDPGKALCASHCTVEDRDLHAPVAKRPDDGLRGATGTDDERIADPSRLDVLEDRIEESVVVRIHPLPHARQPHDGVARADLLHLPGDVSEIHQNRGLERNGY